jgi:maltooligosyltrehalose trehalohydrolase
MTALKAPRAGAWIEGTAACFRVWSPDHHRLELVLFDGDRRSELGSVAMEREPGGYFYTELAGQDQGIGYKYRIDGEGPYPDPLSRSQRWGVHGPSELIDLGFSWTDAAWRGVPLEALVLYELHVGAATKAGTFEALVPRLGEIRALGATAIELMPVASFPGRRNWGYDGVGLYAPSQVYGGPRGLQRLIDAAHAAGLAVLIDVVYSHLGPDGNYLRAFCSRYFTGRHHTPWGEALAYDGDDAASVREFALANAEMWIRDYHADGLRLDATHAIYDTRQPHLLTELAQRARTAAPERHVVVLAEDERNEARLVTAVERGGAGLDGVWADDFHHQVRRAFAGDTDGYYADYTGSARDLAQTLSRGWFYEGQRSAHLDRPRGSSAAAIDPPRLIHCVQNHDQIGNRAQGERLGQSVSPAAFRALSALLLLSPYTPLLFMGQEWNATTPFLYFTDHHEALGRAVTEGRRREFRAFAAFTGQTVPDPQADATFERSKLDWAERTRPGHSEVLAWYQALLRLRAEHPCLQPRDRAAFSVRAIGPNAVEIERRAGASAVLLVANIRGPLDHELEPSQPWRVLLHSEEPRFGGQTEAHRVVQAGRLVFEGPIAVVLE